MHRLNVRHQALPGIGDRFELDTSSGSTITVISHRSGRRDIAIARPDGEGPSITTELTDSGRRRSRCSWPASTSSWP